jgi:hypothetical protein
MSPPGYHHCMEVIERHKIFLLLKKYNVSFGPLLQHDFLCLFCCLITKRLLQKLRVRRGSRVHMGAYLTGF